jgi:general secretion pathway protein E
MQRERFEQTLEYLKTLAGLELEERRRPQQGKITAAVQTGQDVEGGFVDIEVRTSGSTQGEQMVLRVLAEEARFRLPDIGLPEDLLETLESIVHEQTGVVLVAGPRQSGTSTTLYAILRTHDAFVRNINTLEASKLMDLENITQTIFDSTAEAGYARQLLSVIRRDPDIIMVGECPNRETAQLVAKNTKKKKFYVGFNAHDSFDALRRWAQLVGDNEVVASGLRAIIAQRLIRKLCPACRQSYHPDPGLLKKANLPPDSMFFQPPQQPATKRGKQVICPHCQGAGYFGRTGLFEVMLVDPTLVKLIRAGAPLRAMSQIKAACRKTGMIYLQEQGIRKVMEGLTSMDEILRAVQPPARPKTAETA